MNQIRLFSFLFLFLNGLCQGIELVDSEQQFKFLGTMAGEQTYTQSHELNNENTYSRIFIPFGPPHQRNLLSKESWDIEKCKALGEDYSFTPWKLRDGRPFGIRSTTQQGGGFFLTTRILEDDASQLSSCQYAMSSFGDKLERLAGIPLQEIQKQCWYYGIRYILNQYFKCIILPKDGDIAIYPNASLGKQAGIYRESKPNWNSVYGGTIEAKWSLTNGYIFQHDVFFVPSYWGDIVQFYRLKESDEMIQGDSVATIPFNPLCTLRSDETFVFNRTTETNKIREDIDSLHSSILTNKYPQIKSLDIDFIGLCYDYAFGKIFKTYHLPEFIEIMPSDKTIKKYFQQLTNPQEGDLVCYYKCDGGSPDHYGVYCGENMVESKWGKQSIYQHPLFYVGNLYGDYVKYYRLK